MPTIEEALQIGWKQHQAGNLRGAEDIYRQVLNVAPVNENAWCFLGMACHDQGRYEEAAAAYREAIRIKPNFPVALSNFGNTLKQQGKLEEAEASCRTALKYKPDYSTAYNNLGVVLVAQGRLEDAAKVFEKSLELVPQDVVAQANLGAALVRQGRFEEGTQNSQRALKINPNYAEAHKNQAIVWLLLGDFARGWPEYEWRWKCPGSALPDVPGPRWDGSSLEGKTILLHWEQGLGDTVHFIRYARRLKQQGARVVVCCQKPLRQLLGWCDGIDELVAAGEPLPPFDFWTPLLSIPGILNTTVETIPGDTGYINPDPERIKHWRNRLSEYHGYRIGIAWQGSPDFHADRQRSIPLPQFERLARLPGARLISLQKGFGVEQIQELKGRFEVIDLRDELDASGPFLDTAAIIPSLDLVISSDTCVPHLSAAMGAPTWVALSISPDWRWLLNREDSPWYPTMRLFRQRTLGDWDEVFGNIADALTERMATQELVSPLPGPIEPVATSPTNAVESIEPLQLEPPRIRSTASGHFIESDDDSRMTVSPDGRIAAEVKLLQQVLRTGDSVLVLGAGAGELVVGLARHVGAAGTVVAFESLQRDYQRLCGNVAVNGLKNVQCFSPAAWPETPGAGMNASDYSKDICEKAAEASRHLACHAAVLDASRIGQPGIVAAQLISRSTPLLYVRGINEAEAGQWTQALASQQFRMFRHRPLGLSDAERRESAAVNADFSRSINLLFIAEKLGQDFPGASASSLNVEPIGDAE